MHTLRRHATSIVVAATLALTSAACAEDEPEADPPPGQDAEADAAPSAPEDEPATTDAEVEAVNIAFSPESLTVAVGTTVTWTNQDVVRHTVTSGEPGDPDGTFDEPLDAEGDTATVTFDEPGTFVYHCDLHRNMTGEVVVE
jgi:plastocyanin